MKFTLRSRLNSSLAVVCLSTAAWYAGAALRAADPVHAGQATLEAGQDAVKINPQNPKQLLFRGKPLVLISASEHYGSVINRPFDFEEVPGRCGGAPNDRDAHVSVLPRVAKRAESLFALQAGVAGMLLLFLLGLFTRRTHRSRLVEASRDSLIHLLHINGNPCSTRICQGLATYTTDC